MVVVYADIETTGLVPSNGSEITEIGLIKVDGTRVIDLYYSFFDIRGTIPIDISQETGITREMLTGFPFPSERIDQIRGFIGRFPIIAYNAPFEKKFLEHYHLVPLGHCFLDLYPWVRDMRLPTVNNKLQTILRHYNILTIFGHRALSDALGLYNLVFTLRWYERLSGAIRL